MFNYLFLSETYEPVARDTCPSPSPLAKFKKAGFLVYFRIFVIFIWNYHYSTQLNRTKGRN
jgi:hypothetical protein